MKKLLLLTMLTLTVVGIKAQRYTDKVDRGLVAVPCSGGYLVSWRLLGEEYYDVKYNLYRNGTKIASDLTKTNFVDGGGSASSTYQVEAVVRGVPQLKSKAVQAWAEQYWAVPVQPVVNRNGVAQPNAVTDGNGNSVAGYVLNDVSLADVDGDGISEFMVKRVNQKGNLYDASNKTDFSLYECYKMDGTRLWWLDMGPNLMAGADEQFDAVGYDWDRDGKAEFIMRGADNMIIHTATGRNIKIGNMNYYAPRDEYTREGAEYLLYLNGETGEPYGWDGKENWTPMAYPLPRYEQGESDYATVWGKNDTGHRSCKHYFGAPYLDGRNPSIFLGRGCYTRHKFCALDVDPATHKLTQRWRWNCYDGTSPWFGNGFHNFSIGDVDMDGRDEIVFGSMMIDDTGYGLSTTGYGHGDAQHCGDLDPYRWGLEQFVCLEGSDKPGLAYTNATTSDVYVQTGTGGDNGRCLAGNFTNDIPGSQGRAVGGAVYALSADKAYSSNADSYITWSDLNMRIYWDGDLCDEIMNSPGTQRSVKISKWGNGRLSFWNSGGLYTPTGILNNSSKNNPSAQGDILGDWREELVLRTSTNDALHVYTTNFPSDYGIYTLWHDHHYRNAMVWQCVGYNQPPHLSYFLGEAEGITMAPPPLLLCGRTEVENGSTIATTDEHLLVSGYEDKTISVQEGAEPYILTVNAPAWVQGTGSRQATGSTSKQPARNIINYTTTLQGGAFSGATRLVKQGEGILVLPNVEEKHTGRTDVWNGTLVFDGTMTLSPVWLNRHTTLISDGGRFMGGLTADYNATIYVGGKDKVGSLTASVLKLGFGSRLVLDYDGTSFDQLNADQLTIETKSWEFGPKYKTPVVQINISTPLEEGTYQLGAVGDVSGNISDLLIEGLGNDVKATLSLDAGKLNLVVEEMREATTVVWNGTASDSFWQQAVSMNFLNNGEVDYSASGDDIIFDDNAASSIVYIKGSVSPRSVTFNNETRAYTVNGDSIVGGATITKNGAARVTINTENHTGETFINKGTMVVSQLANTKGQNYGSLGDAKQSINLGDGATLQTNGVIITDQPLRLSGVATVDVPSGKSVIFNRGITGSGATLVKSGSGSMETGTSGNSYSKLVLKGGTFTSNYSSSHVEQLPATVEFQGGTLWAANDEGTNVDNNANFVVEAGNTGTIYCGFRSTYKGRLTGGGTFNVYTGGVRCYFDGDWSQFTGTIKANKNNRQNKKSYDPSWAFRNEKGLPNATLSVEKNCYVSNEGKNIVLGALSGSGTLTGSGQWILGSNGDDFFLSTEIGVTSERTNDYGGTIGMSASPVTKSGAGKMTFLTLGKLNGALTVQEGTVAFNNAALDTYVNGANATVVKNGGRIVGQGRLSTLTLQNGALLIPCGSIVNETTPGTIKTTALLTAAEGSVVNFLFNSSKQSQLQPSMLAMNGTVKVTLLNGYTPKAGDEFTLWTTSTYRGTPTFDLPELPEGLYWDTRDVAAKTGILRITDDSSLGIGRLTADTLVSCQVYTLGGTLCTSFDSLKGEVRQRTAAMPLASGTYVVKMHHQNRTEVMKVVVR